MTFRDYLKLANYLFWVVFGIIVAIVGMILIGSSLPYWIGVWNPTEISIQNIVDGKVVPPVYGATLEGVQVIDTGYHDSYYYGVIILDQQHVLLLEQDNPINPSVNTYTGVIEIANNCACKDIIANVSQKKPELKGKIVPVKLTLTSGLLPSLTNLGLILLPASGFLLFGHGRALRQHIRYMRYVPDVEETFKNLK